MGFIEKVNGKLDNIKKKKAGESIYLENRRKYGELFSEGGRFPLVEDYDYPCLTDRFAQAGTVDQYFWQDTWAAKLIYENKPEMHYDIGSSVKGFIAHLMSFRGGIMLIDVRPLEVTIPGVGFQQADATNLSGIEDESVESISALCSLEHFGLGRYGDPVDPEAWEKAMKSIVRVVKPGGHAYISVPVGKEHLEFDAHRIFYASTIEETFKPMKLLSYSCTGDHNERIIENVPLHQFDEEMNRGHRFGLFHFIKSDD